jgi:hypothetical protein
MINLNKVKTKGGRTAFLKCYKWMIYLGMAVLNIACMINEYSNSPQQMDVGIKGSGILISEELDLVDFHSVSMCTAGLVTIVRGNEQRVSITVDDNIREHIVLSVVNEELVISVAPNIRLTRFDLTVEVIMTDLEALTTNSAGSIIGKSPFETDYVSLVINSAGNISIDIKAEEIVSVLNSAGSLMLSGETPSHYAQVSSAGNMLAFDLKTDTTIIMLNSAGNAQVSALNLLDITINSCGSLYYKGTAKVVQRINSIGQVICVN